MGKTADQLTIGQLLAAFENREPGKATEAVLGLLKANQPKDVLNPIQPEILPVEENKVVAVTAEAEPELTPAEEAAVEAIADAALKSALREVILEVFKIAGAKNLQEFEQFLFEAYDQPYMGEVDAKALNQRQEKYDSLISGIKTMALERAQVEARNILSQTENVSPLVILSLIRHLTNPLKPKWEARFAEALASFTVPAESLA